MSIAPEHDGIVIGFSILAGVIGALLGWFPGSDLIGLSIVWIVGFSLILAKSDVARLKSPTTRILLALIGAAFVIATGVEIASGLALPFFLVVNPFLNAFATYRILRTASKLFASDDPEELSSNLFSNVVSVLSLVAGVSK
jgi:hypothetical protein